MAQRYLKTSTHKPRGNNYFEQSHYAADHNVRPWSAIVDTQNPEVGYNYGNSYLEQGIANLKREQFGSSLISYAADKQYDENRYAGDRQFTRLMYTRK